MMTNAEVIKVVDEVFGPSKTEAELLDKALRLVAAYNQLLDRSDRNFARLVKERLARDGA